jgi:hypothetical protein
LSSVESRAIDFAGEYRLRIIRNKGLGPPWSLSHNFTT